MRWLRLTALLLLTAILLVWVGRWLARKPTEVSVRIPARCVQSLHDFYRNTTIYALERDVDWLKGHLRWSIPGCTVGFSDEDDVHVTSEMVSHLIPFFKALANQDKVDAYVQTFLTSGCVTVSDVKVCRAER